MIERVSLFPFDMLKNFKTLHHGGTKTLGWKTTCPGIFVVQILFLILLFIPSTVFASSLNATRINISLSNSEGQALPNVQISMDLYFYEHIAMDQLELRGAYSDECTTDAQGVCSILIGETQDLLLRGSLDLGEYGSRNVEWHGGALDVPIRIKHESKTQFNHVKMYGVILIVLIALGVIVQYKRARL
jgi:hypothetical protein